MAMGRIEPLRSVSWKALGGTGRHWKACGSQVTRSSNISTGPIRCPWRTEPGEASAEEGRRVRKREPGPTHEALVGGPGRGCRERDMLWIPTAQPTAFVEETVKRNVWS